MYTPEFSLGTRQVLVQIARRMRPLEACGLITDAGAVVNMRNAAPNPAEYFVMDPAQVLETYSRLEELGERVVGVFHSHPESQLEWSDVDIQNWLPNLANVLVLPSGFIRIVTLSEGGYGETFADG